MCSLLYFARVFFHLCTNICIFLCLLWNNILVTFVLKNAQSFTYYLFSFLLLEVELFEHLSSAVV